MALKDLNLKMGFVSLGCAKNLVDTETMLGLLKMNHIEITSEPSEADVLIVNTCAFIETAKSESITTILNMAEYKKPEQGKCKALIIAGCLGERYGKELLDELPEADAIIGTGSWDKILDVVQETLNGEKVILVGEKKIIYESKTPRIFTTPNYLAYVKIAEGCDHRCAFCAIPNIRGNFRSRPIEDIQQEVQNLAASGVKEINLIAQDTTSYGKDLYGQPSLAKLLKTLCHDEKNKNVRWFRILYAYPRFFTDELIETIASEERICNYIDLPLQHAHDAILKRMRRFDTKETIEALLKKIRERIPDVVIRSTFMVGFPGETDVHYQTLRKFLEKQRFDRVGIFTYSREEGTPAYDFGGQVPEEIAQERYHDLMSLQSKISEEINQNCEGKIFEVMVEGHDAEQDQIAFGRSYREAPEVDGQIYIENDETSQAGDFVQVKISQGFAYDAVGEKISDKK